MKKIASRFFLLLTLLFIYIPATMMGQEKMNTDVSSRDTVDRLAPDFVTTSICIADPTDWHDDMLGVMGHAFIRMQCPTFSLDYCFSYEGQSANENFGSLLSGNLKMGLFAVPTNEYVKPYRKWNRTVREYTLNLPPIAKQRLWQILDNRLKDGTELPLDLSAHGCVQTIVQNVILALDTIAVEYGEWPEEYAMSRSEIVDNALYSYPWLRLLAKTLGMYGDFDQDCTNEEKIILPRQIVEVFGNAKINGAPMLTFKGEITKGATVVVERPWFTPAKAGIILSVVFLLIIYLCIRRRQRTSK